MHSIIDLKNMAKIKGIKGYYNMNKQDLIKVLNISLEPKDKHKSPIKSPKPKSKKNETVKCQCYKIKAYLYSLTKDAGVQTERKVDSQNLKQPMITHIKNLMITEYSIRYGNKVSVKFNEKDKLFYVKLCGDFDMKYGLELTNSVKNYSDRYNGMYVVAKIIF